MNTIWLSLLKSKWTWIILAFISLGTFAYIQYHRANELEFDRDIWRQNEAAMRDSLTKTRDSIQTTATFIRRLNDDKKRLDERYSALQAKYNIAIDSIKFYRIGIAKMKNDSIAEIPHDGKQSIANWTGNTQLNIWSKTFKTTLTLTFDPIFVESELFFDRHDNLWKMRSISKTTDINVIGYSTVDESLLREIRGLQPEPKSPGYVAIGGLVSSTHIYGSVMLKPNDWMIGLNYRVYDKFALPTDTWKDRIALSVHYFLF